MNPMRSICLVRPPATECFRLATTSISLPLGLAYVAAALEAAGRRIHVVDAVGEAPARRTRYITGFLIGLSLEEVADRIPADADLVGITVIFTHEWPAVVRLTQLIKARRPDVKIVLGGEHITSLPEFCLATSAADFLILGEGEETVVELADALESGRALGEIDGLVWRDGANVVVNRRRNRRKNVDDIPPPAWHHFAVRRYHAHRYVGGMYSPTITLPILATRGCPYQCTYCSSPNMWTPLWVPRDPVKVADEIQGYVETYGARNFPFQDLTAILQRDWIIAFCKEIIRRDLNISWQLPFGTRSEAIDPEVATLLKQSGMLNVAYAPESGSETTRRYIKKKMRTERLFQSIQASVAADLNVTVFIVIGLPHDQPEHLAENLPFVRRLAENGVRDISISFYMALPGTELFESLYDNGKITFDRAYFYHMIHSLALVPVKSYCENVSRTDLMRWKFRIFSKFYFGRSPDGSGVVGTLRRTFAGFAAGGQDSKLPFAIRNAMMSGWDTLRTRFARAWMPRAEEERLFEGWDEIYRTIHASKRQAGVTTAPPADTTQLHLRNVLGTLRREHGEARTVRVAKEVAKDVAEAVVPPVPTAAAS